MAEPDRRRFRRLEGAPVLWRPSGKPHLARQQATNISADGIRLFADAPHLAGERLELNLFLPDRSEVTCTVEVVWIEGLPVTAPARFDVGMRFVEISPLDRAKLSALLEGG